MDEASVTPSMTVPAAPVGRCVSAACLFGKADSNRDDCLDDDEFYQFVHIVVQVMSWGSRKRSLHCCGITANGECVDFVEAQATLRCIFGEEIGAL